MSIELTSKRRFLSKTMLLVLLGSDEKFDWGSSVRRTCYAFTSHSRTEEYQFISLLQCWLTSKLRPFLREPFQEYEFKQYL